MGMTVCWLAEPKPHTELAPGGAGAPFLWGTRPVASRCSPCRAGTVRVRCLCAWNAARAAVLPGSPRAPDLCRSTFSPPFHASFSSPSFFFFLFSLVLPVHCLAPFFFFPPYCSQASLLTQRAARFRAPCLVCIQNGVLSSQRRGPWSPSPHWDMILACRRGYFYYFILWPQSTSRVSPFWMLLAMDCSRTGGVATGAHRLHPDVAAPAICPLPCGAGLPAACRGIRACPASARPPEEKKKGKEKKFHFCFVCPHFICIT